MRDGNTLLGTFPWSVINVGGLGFVTGLSYPVDGTCMGCRTDVGGAYRREGTTGPFTQIISTTSVPSGIIAAQSAVGGSHFGVWELAIAPSNAGIWWMFFRGRALRSADRGVTWADTNLNGTTGLYMDSNGGNQRLVADKAAVDPSNPEVVYCGSQRDGLWRRLSSAWANIASVPTPAPSGGSDNDKTMIICIDPVSSLTGAGATSRRSVVYASSNGNGIYQSTDGGTTFALMSAHPGAGASYSCRGMTIDQAGKLYVCLDNGAANNVWTWNGASWSNITYASNIRSLFVDPKDATRLVGNSGGNFPVKSNDGGATWGLWNPPDQTAVATSVPIVASVLEATFRGAAGASFAAIKPHPTVAKDFIAMGLGVCYFNSPWPAKAALSQVWVEDTAGIEELVANGVTITPNGDTLLCSHDKAIIRVPSDGTFPAASYPTATLTNGYAVDWAIDDPSRLVCLVQKNGNWSGYSTDGGQTWAAFAASYSANEGGTIAQGNAGNIVVAPGQNGWPHYSTDNGATWAYCTFTGATQIAEGTENGFGFGSTDTRRHILCADKDAPGTFYIFNYGPSGSAATYQGLWKSIDGGITFARVNSTSIISNAGYHAVLKCVQGDLYLVAGDLGSWFTNDGGSLVVKSTNGGVSWTTVSGITEAMIAFGKAPYGGTYPTMYMIGWYGGTYGLHRSYDGGATIVTLTAYTNYDQPWALDADPTKFGRVVVGFSGTGWVERDYRYTMAQT